VQPALIKTSVVGNVRKETGIHRERKKNINKTYRATPAGGERSAQ